ncbi:MAG: 23S rRNA (guanosine(2251)-2'-O)-methyltransferase RlmB, partial [Myxococcota bacterium]
GPGRTGPHQVAGPRAVVELLRHAPGRVQALWMDRRHEDTTLDQLAQTAGVSVQWTSARTLAQRAPALESQGVLAHARPPTLLDFEDVLDRALAPLPSGSPAPSPAPTPSSSPSESPSPPVAASRRIVVALDGVQDPQNLGAIMRTCEFFGVLALVWPRDRAAGVTPAVVRASAGASERLPLCRVVNLARALEGASERGLWVMGTVPQGGQPLPRMVAEDRIPEPLLVVMGGEHGGLRRLTRARCDLLVTIPGRGGVASLNVSAATAAALACLW